MSPVDPQVPPAGEDMHIPEGSIQPFLLTLFVTTLLIGLTFHWIVLAIGIVGTLWVLFAWIRDAKHELDELPVHHDAH